MFAQKEKPKEGHNRAAANSVAQRKLPEHDNQSNPDGENGALLQRMFRPPRPRRRAAPAGPAPAPTPRQRRIDAVRTTMATPGGGLPAAQGQGVLVFHPPTPDEPWEYTRTVQYTVQVPNVGQTTVRGHVHYTNSTGAVGPGNMWIRGVDGYSFRTPAAVVGSFNTMPDEVARTRAVEEYNTRHGTTHSAL